MPCVLAGGIFVGNMLESMKLLAPGFTLPCHTLSLPWNSAKTVLGLCVMAQASGEAKVGLRF